MGLKIGDEFLVTGAIPPQKLVGGSPLKWYPTSPTRTTFTAEKKFHSHAYTFKMYHYLSVMNKGKVRQALRFRRYRNRSKGRILLMELTAVHALFNMSPEELTKLYDQTGVMLMKEPPAPVIPVIHITRKPKPTIC